MSSYANHVRDVAIEPGNPLPILLQVNEVDNVRIGSKPKIEIDHTTTVISMHEGMRSGKFLLSLRS